MLAKHNDHSSVIPAGIYILHIERLHQPDLILADTSMLQFQITPEQ